MEPVKKPAVFVFTTAYYPLIGGAEIAIQEVAKRLTGDFRFFIFTARLRRDLPRREIRPEGEIIRIGFGNSFDKVLIPFIGAFKVLQFGRREYPGLYWCVMASWGSGAAYVANVIHFWKRVPVLLTLQEGDSETHIRRRRFGLVGFSWRRALARTDFLTTISNYLRDFGYQFGYRGPVEVIPNGVELATFEKPSGSQKRQELRTTWDAKSEDIVLITTSRLTYKNAIDTLILAFVEAIQKAPHVKLVIVGDGEERGKIEALIRDNGISEKVYLGGSIRYEEIPNYLAASDIFIRASRSEGLGNSFLEAMAAGLPIIGTLVGGIPDFMRDGENGLGVRVDNPADIAEKIVRLATDGELRRRLAKGGKKTVRETYEWNVISNQYRNIFKKLSAHPEISILIATPNFPPDIGGPATFAENIASELAHRGSHVSVLTYGKDKKDYHFGGFAAVSSALPRGIRHLVFFIRALGMVRRASVVLLLDAVGVGLPIMRACRILGRPYILRTEGDPTWERFVERTGRDITLADFRKQNAEEHNASEKMFDRAIQAVSKNASRVIFSSEWRRLIFLNLFSIRQNRSKIIRSIIPAPTENSTKRDSVIIFAGRFLFLKNLERLIDAFGRASLAGYTLELIGAGPMEGRIAKRVDGNPRIRIRPPMTRLELQKRLTRARAVVLPSLSDVSPNIILEAISAGTPFILTRESGFTEWVGDAGLLVNPLDVGDITDKLRLVGNDQAYQKLMNRLQELKIQRSWADVADDWFEVILEVVPSL